MRHRDSGRDINRVVLLIALLSIRLSLYLETNIQRGQQERRLHSFVLSLSFSSLSLFLLSQLSLSSLSVSQSGSHVLSNLSLSLGIYLSLFLSAGSEIFTVVGQRRNRRSLFLFLRPSVHIIARRDRGGNERKARDEAMRRTSSVTPPPPPSL